MIVNHNNMFKITLLFQKLTNKRLKSVKKPLNYKENRSSKQKKKEDKKNLKYYKKKEKENSKIYEQIEKDKNLNKE